MKTIPIIIKFKVLYVNCWNTYKSFRNVLKVVLILLALFELVHNFDNGMSLQGLNVVENLSQKQ